MREKLQTRVGHEEERKVRQDKCKEDTDTWSARCAILASVSYAAGLTVASSMDKRARLCAHSSIAAEKSSSMYGTPCLVARALTLGATACSRWRGSCGKRWCSICFSRPPWNHESHALVAMLRVVASWKRNTPSVASSSAENCCVQRYAHACIVDCHKEQSLASRRKQHGEPDSEPAQVSRHEGHIQPLPPRERKYPRDEQKVVAADEHRHGRDGYVLYTGEELHATPDKRAKDRPSIAGSSETAGPRPAATRSPALSCASSDRERPCPRGRQKTPLCSVSWPMKAACCKDRASKAAERRICHVARGPAVCEFAARSRTRSNPMKRATTESKQSRAKEGEDDQLLQHVKDRLRFERALRPELAPKLAIVACCQIDGGVLRRCIGWVGGRPRRVSLRIGGETPTHGHSGGRRGFKRSDEEGTQLRTHHWRVEELELV
eukprot:scaffold260599_cov32-Tisochrysis_lutea.AAC.2